MSAATSPEVIKEPSMVKQKEMIAGNYDRLTSTKESGDRKVVSTFVPGNLNELIMCFDMVTQPARDQRDPERHAQEERQ
jgi:benzoyl-CoA reductase subunit B